MFAEVLEDSPRDGSLRFLGFYEVRSVLHDSFGFKKGATRF